MKVEPRNPPRLFEVGNTIKFKMRDCGSVRLEPDEQVTFTTESGAEYDLARKSWGFYATPSVNARLPQFGLRAVLVKNPIDRFFVLLVERGKDAEFDEYVRVERLEIVCWLDSSESLARIERALRDE